VSAPKGLLLSKSIDGFLLACRARRLSEHTLTDYSRTLKRFLEHIGDTVVTKITTTQVSAFLAAQPYSEKTVLNYHIGLSALWTWLIREGYTDKHILRLVEKPKPKKIAVQPFTETEIKAMLNCVKRNNERDKSMILLLLDTGLRASELIGIELSKLDLVNRRVVVLGKGNKERAVPFSARTASAIFRYTSTLSDASGKLYPYSRNSLADLIADIGKRAGLKKAHPHRFRHTFAITYLRNGGDPYTLQEILGHTTMEMVKEYISLAQVDIDAAHKRASPVEGWKL
jgi:site-specific recombinase XerD